MNCTLDRKQQEQLFAKVFKDLLDTVDKSKEFNFRLYARSIYDLVQGHTKDNTLALTYVSLLPQNIRMSVGQRASIAKLVAPTFSEIVDLESQFEDLETVTEYLGISEQAVKDIQVSVKTDSELTGTPIPKDTLDKRDITFQAMPLSPLATWGQEGYFIDFERDPAERRALKDVPDPEKKWHYDVTRKILRDTRDGKKPNLYVSVISSTRIPEDSVYPEFRDPKRRAAIERYGMDHSIALAITDGIGNLVYFDDNFEITSQDKGKVAYTYMRIPKLEKKEFILDFGEVVSIEDLLRKEDTQRRDNGVPPYTEKEANIRRKELHRQRQEQFRLLYEISQYIKSDPLNNITTNITGGSFGYFNNEVLTPLSATNVSDQEILGIRFERDQGENAGYSVIKLNNVDRTIRVDRPEMTSDIAEKIADVLTKSLEVEGTPMFPSDRASYAKQFLYFKKKPDPSQPIFIEADDRANTLVISLAGERIELSTLKTPVEVENAKNRIVQALMTAVSTKTGKRPVRMNINGDHLKTGQYIDYEISGDNATRQIKSYAQFLRDTTSIYAQVNSNGDISELNAYLTFSVPDSELGKIRGDKSPEEVTSPLNTEVQYRRVEPGSEIDKILRGSPLDKKETGDPDQFLDALKKLKAIPNDASKQQILDAKTWYETSPLSKHVPFTEMFNIVNSDAFAQWTVDGITLFEGSNYTDLYHEAWHGFSQLFLSRQQKRDLYKEARKLSGSFKTYSGTNIPFSLASDLQLEEHIAEDFRKYVISKGKSILGGRPHRNSIFRRILNFLRELFFGVTMTEAMSQMETVSKIKDLYDKLYLGNLNEYRSSIDNVQFGRLNKGLQSLTNPEDTLSLEDSRTLVESVDSLLSEAVNKKNFRDTTHRFTTTLFTDRENLRNAYAYVKARLTQYYNDWVIKAEEEENPFVKEQYLSKARILGFGIDNYGNIDQVLAGKETEGLVAYQRQKSRYLGVSEKLYDIGEDPSNSEEAIKGTLRVGDRSGNELSLKQLAQGQTLYLIRSVHKIRDGKSVLNKVGIPELADFDKVWNSLVRTLAGSYEPMEIFRRLNEYKNIHPEFAQILDKLGTPYKDYANIPSGEGDNAEFDLWTGFWQDFNKPRISLVQLVIDRVETKVGGEVTEIKYDMRGGEVSADFYRVKSNWKNKFRVDDPTQNPYIKKDLTKVNYLDLPKIISTFSEKGKVPKDKTFDFLRAIGFYLDDKPDIRVLVSDKYEDFGVNWLLKALVAAEEAKVVISDPIDFLESSHPKIGIESNSSGRVKKILSFHSRVSDEFSNFSSINPENNREYEHSLNNSMTKMVEGVNRGTKYQDMRDIPKMSYLDSRRNPFVKSSVLLNSIFILDVPETDSRYGQRRKSNLEEGSKVVTLKLENLSGTQLLVNSLYPEIGVKTSKSDRTTKFLEDFHMLLLHGRSEVIKHASKSTSYDLVVDKIITDPTKKDSNLYVDIDTFVSRSGSDDYSGFGQAFDILMKYLGAELSRVHEVRTNKDIYKKAKGYNRPVEGKDDKGESLIAGEVLTAFDDILSQDVKQKLYTLIKTGEFVVEIQKDKYNALKIKIREQVKNYFDKQVSLNEEIMNENRYIHPEIIKKISSKRPNLPPGDMQKAALRAFTYNQWMHNFESTILIYGDSAQYNHDKKEFVKRNSGAASTGYVFRTDQGAQDFINNYWSRPYTKSKNLPVSRYDGTMNTSVLQDMEIQSIYLPQYEKALRDYFTKRYSKSKLSDKERKKIVEERVQSAIEPYTKMKEGDGQGWVGFDAYRILRKLENKWSDRHEKLYQDIIAGREVYEDITSFFPVYKAQYYGPLANQIKENGLPITAMHKFSLFPLIPTVIKGTELEKMHDKMMREEVDYTLFESGSKVGSVTSDGRPDAYYTIDSEGNRRLNEEVPFTKNTIYLDYLKDQVDIADEYKGNATFSTQLRKLIISGLFEGGSPVNKEAGEIADRYIKNIDLLTELKKQELLREAGWQEDEDGNISGPMRNLLEIARTTLSARDFSDHELEFLDYNEETGDIAFDLSLHPSSEQIEKILTALIANRLVRQKIRGEALVQVSTSMFEKKALIERHFKNPSQDDLDKYGTNDLPSYRKPLKEENPDYSEKTLAMKVKIALQGDFGNLLKLRHKDGNRIGTGSPEEQLRRLNETIRDEEWLNKDKNRKMVTMVGARIPVQGLNSMEFMEVYEFLPTSAGSVIVPPSEIVAKAGADFDIDKLTIFMPAISKNGSYLSKDFDSIEAIEKRIREVESEKDTAYNNLGKRFDEAKVAFKAGKSLETDKMRELLIAMEVATDRRAQLLDNIRENLTQIEGYTRVPKELVGATGMGDIELLRALNQVNSGLRKLKDIDESVHEDFLAIKSLREDIDSIREELESSAGKNETLYKKYSDLRQQVREQLTPYKDQLRYLNEQKTKFMSTVENAVIEDIRTILELPQNFVSLIRPNNTDIAKPISENLEPHVSKYNPNMRISDTTSKRFSPTRIFEAGYNLYVHETSNIAGKALGIAAVENTYDSIFDQIGAYLQEGYTYTTRKGKKQPRRIKILLNHNSQIYTDNTGVEKTGISLSSLYDANGEHRVSDIISQIMNGLVDIVKDTWVSNIQGNNEIMPVFLFLLKTGVPVKEAAWFVSQPLVLEYVKQQRLMKSTFAEPLGRVPRDYQGKINYNFFRVRAREAITTELLGKEFTVLDLYKEIVNKTGEETIKPETIEKIVTTQDRSSEDAVKAFLHYIEIEEMMKGIQELKFATNVDTKRSTSLFDAIMRTVRINSLRENSRLAPELVDKIMDESVIGSFFVQDFQVKLLGKLFKFRNNDIVNTFLKDKLNRSQADVEDTFDDQEEFVRTFKNDLVSFVFQNQIKGFNLSHFKTYKGFDATTEVPIKLIDKLDFGAFVKEDVMYIDKTQLEKDWESGLYTKSNKEKNNYNSRGLATLDPTTFTWQGVKNKNEFFHFVVEREYLRSTIPFSDYRKTLEFKRANLLNQQIPKLEGENQESFERRVKKITYEETLRDKALQNIFNLKTLFSDPVNSIGGQFLSIVNRNPSLEKDYSLIANMGVSTDLNLKMYNLVLKDRDLDTLKKDNYHENLNNLSDISIKKVEDPQENRFISEFFIKLPFYAYLQSGLSKNEFSFTSIVSPEPFAKIMEKPTQDFTDNYLSWKEMGPEDIKSLDPNLKKLLDKDPSAHRAGREGTGPYIKKESGKYFIQENPWMLDIFYEYFLNNNQKYNRRMRSRFKNYVVNRASSKIATDILNRDILVDFNRTSDPNTVTFDGYVKRDELMRLLNSYPDIIFVHKDTFTAVEKNLHRAGNEGDMKMADNAVGIRSSFQTFNGDWGAKTSEQVEKIKSMIEEDLQPAIEARKAGKTIAFSSGGFGTKLKGLDREIFLYLSKRLYEEFGYINPTSLDETSLREIVESQQGISQQEVEESIRNCA